MNKDRISVNWCRNKGLQGRRGENRGEGECVWRMGLGARPERIPKASRRNGGRGMTQKRQQDNTMLTEKAYEAICC